jgi:hypothetical protein
LNSLFVETSNVRAFLENCTIIQSDQTIVALSVIIVCALRRYQFIVPQAVRSIVVGRAVNDSVVSHSDDVYEGNCNEIDESETEKDGRKPPHGDFSLNRITVLVIVPHL